MGYGSSNISTNLTNFNNTNTLLKYEPQIFDNRMIEREFDDYEEYDGFELIKVDYSRDDASAQNPLIIRDEFEAKVVDHSKDDASAQNT